MITALQAASIALFTGVGAAWPRSGDGRLLRRDTAVNLATGAVLAAVRWGGLAWVVHRMDVGLVDVSALPAWGRAVLAFLLLDLARWALHLAHHRVPLLWRFHRVHHSSESLDATAGLRMHVVDLVQLTLLPPLVLGVLLDLSGSPAWVAAAALAPAAVLDAFEHGDLRFDASRGLGWLWDRVLNNPHFHAWHHSADGAEHDGNYGNVLTVWDRLFGTCVSRPGLPDAFGLAGAERVATDVVGLQLLRRPTA